MKRVLILDDDRDLCEVLSEIIFDMGSKICESVNSLEELARIESFDQYDIIFLDLNLGPNRPTGLDGYNWLIEHGYQGEVIFLTGHDRENSLVQKILDLPNVTVVEKPTDISVIESLIQ